MDFILLQETVVVDEWINFQLDIVHDYERIFGSLPDDIIWYIELIAYCGASSKLTVIFDDMYIYYDVAPEITSIDQTPSVDDEDGEIVTITVDVIDGSEVTVMLSYRVNAGAWANVTLDEITSGSYSVDIIAPVGNTEYFITAEDAFGKTDTAMDGGSYFTFTTGDTVGPVISLLPANGTIVSDIVSIEFNVTDTGSGFAWSQLFIEGAEITNTTIATVGVSWDTTVIANGEYNITVIAEDSAGNSATVTHLVTVENLDGSAGDSTGAIILIVIIALAGVIMVLYFFVFKKK